MNSAFYKLTGKACVLMGVVLAGCSCMAATKSNSPGVSPGGLMVTKGEITQNAQGYLVIDNPEVRAVLPGSTGQAAKLRFVYRGPTTEKAPLKSGEERRQIALKLRAQNGCNVVYVAWRMEPRSEILVLVKHNSQQARHAECGVKGYQTVVPRRKVAAPNVKLNEWHALSGRIDGVELRVFADDTLVWEGALPQTVLDFNGPMGIRTDNARFEIELVKEPDRP